MKDYTYIKERIIIYLKNGKTFIFSTESDSITRTQWLYDIDNFYIKVYNCNNKKFSFPLCNIDYWEIPSNLKENESIIKEIRPNVFEINDYIKA